MIKLFELILQYFGYAQIVLSAVEGALSAIAAGQPYTSPSASTYIEGKHVNVSVVINPAS